MCPTNLGIGRGRMNNNGKRPPIIHVGRSFFGSLQQYTNHNVETSNHVSMKFCVDIICLRLEIVGPFNHIRQVAPHSQTALPVSVTQLLSLWFLRPWFSRPIGLVWDITIDYGYLGTESNFGYIWASFDGLLSMNLTLTWQPYWPSHCSGGDAWSLQPG